MNAPAIIQAARMPQTYENARVALSECSQIDECKEWADKAAALASYARQAEDDQLERMAARIRARAIRRAGELLKQIEPAPNHHGNSSMAGGHPSSRKEAASEAGMSPHQSKQAIRIASVPDQDFERQVESDKPPTLSQLAQQGIQRRDPPPQPEQWLQGRDPKQFNKALHFTALVTEYAAELSKSGVSQIIPHLDEGQRMKLRSALRQIDAIHDQIATRI